ncbi:hypothetical protein HWD35_19885 [Tsukamurella tyrosinosolvens]|jgi:hypothetical protein|uniref:Uncharacterized protein n=1 Tax=Tsukamurella tyrosinosolvens TaxID=57704 RepID=A0A1H4PMF8_TSUTY|nr:hypothetical protein [Tsukamurella tyrosinosolvens]AUN39671.1 hypothetical protein ASU32_06290 [Tsukamurella tyrosinosolvens]KXP08900.1 hypothetical protein AXK59_00325 [Tsukamurella tyrosinosolvens]KZL97128.1 hypothetical protein AXX05_16865 [Tsukamurella tyrosinosolvens]MCA4996984.1 hypothetical protein [Tsukamurella tyrosinosolvens]MEC4616409.1 hypothetical protein [Tsukamurella tyrosinosolvens]
MTNYRDFKSLTADPTAGTVYARLADIHEDAAKPTAAPRSGFAAAGLRAAMQRFVTANPEYTGPAALRF